MKNNRILRLIVAGFLTIMLVSVFTVSGCEKNPLLGEWQEDGTWYGIEFMSNGRLLVRIPVGSGARSVTGTYTLEGDDEIHPVLDYANSWLNVFAGDTWYYTVNSTTLTLKNDYNNNKTEFFRLR